MNIGQAIADLGVDVPDDLDGCLMALKDGRTAHATVDRLRDRDVGEFDDLYLASGWFAPGSIGKNGGRSEENLREVFWIPFDADLADYLGCPKDDLWVMSDADLMAMVERQRVDLTEVFALAQVPIHRLDYTGYGLCAYTYVDPKDRVRVADVRKAHKAIVARLNALVGPSFNIVDPQVSDAGTRVTRVPGTKNTKGAIPRTVKTLFYDPGFASLETKWAANPPPRVVIPDHGKGLTPEAITGIVDALRPHWVLGQMHYLGLAVAGLLAKGGVPEEQAVAILDSLGDEKPWRSAACVKNSYDRVRSGLAAAGFTRLRDLLPPDALNYVARQVDAVAQATMPRLTIRGAKPEERKRVAPVPDAAYYGWFGDYCDLMEPTTEAPRVFHLGASLTLAGAMIGRRVHTEYASDPLYANLYTVLIGSSGSSRKDTAIKRALAIPQLFLDPSHLKPPPYYLATDVGSAEGLITLLKERQNALLYFTELSTVLRNAKRKATNTILPRLIEAWDTPSVLQNLNKNSPVQAMNPYLSIIAAVQPGTLAQEITDEDIHSGFANRWLYIPGEGGEPLAVAPSLDKAMGIKRYRDLDRAIGEYNDGTVIPLLPETHDRWAEWYLGVRRQSGRNEDEDAMRVRNASLIQKIALIYAVSDGAQGVGDRHLEAAIALVDWTWGHVKDLLKSWGVGIESQIERRIVASLERHGPTPKRILTQRTANRKWSGRDFANVLRAMSDNGTVLVDAGGIVALVDEES